MPKVRLADGSVVEVGAADLFQDDGATPFVPPTPTAGDQFFTAGDIARVQAEADARMANLQTTITELQNTTSTLSAAEEQRLAAAQAEQDRLAEEARRAELAGLSDTQRIEAQIAEQQRQWEERINSLTTTLETERELRAKEASFNELSNYASDLVRAHTEGENADIAPELIPYITGNTREEIDASVARAQETTAQILAQMQQLVPQEQQQFPVVVDQQVQVPVTPGTRAFSGPIIDPAAGGTQTFTPDQIKNMSLADYAKIRPKLVGAAQQNTNRGLFG